MNLSSFQYNAKFDKRKLAALLFKRGLSKVDLDTLPEVGLIVVNDKEIIAAGFIRMIENSNSALIDSYITDSDQDPETRNKALDLLTTAIIDKAKSLKLNALLAISVDTNTLVRASKHGFVSLEHKLMSLSLTSGQGD